MRAWSACWRLTAIGSERPGAFNGPREAASIGQQMTALAKIVPRAEIEQAVPGASFEEMTAHDLKDFARRKPETLRELALSSWDYALSGEFNHVDPRLFADEVDENDPKLLTKMERALGVKLLRDLYHFEATARGDAAPFAEGTFAVVYPTRLHIADIKMLDPSRPRSGADWSDQTHHSLRLFPALLNNAVRVAREIGTDRITLTAANRSLHDAFARHGFSLADTRSARPAFEFGAGIAMMLVLA